MTSAEHPVSKNRATGKVLTVLGPIEPAKVGVTLTHEHLFIDFRPVFQEPEGATGKRVSREKVTLENLGWVRYNWNGSLDNLQILDEEITIREAAEYFKAGGSTIVDVTSVGLARDPEALARVSRATGLNVVMGAGYYVGVTHSDWFRKAGVDEVAHSIIRDVEKGVDGAGIRAGIIGEIGCSWPWTESEKKSLHAAVIAQIETGAPLLIHPGRNEKAPMELLNAVDGWGGDLKRTVMGHIERTIYDRGALKEAAQSGAYLNFDLFGHESSYYPFAADTYMPADHERIQMIEYVAGLGRQDRILLAHDICTKHRLKTYGGHGWDHLIARVAPRMRKLGFSEELLRMVFVDNPTRMLTFK
ncbi:MAG: aryldialkylphosphatase [Dehalococcoidia bacterium]|nr:aryldialkylphosphatase [Dehalococcoidia bacterium]